MENVQIIPRVQIVQVDEDVRGILVEQWVSE